MSELVDKDAFLKQERKWYCENCDRRKGVKNGRKCFVYEIGEVPCRACDVDDVLDDLECFETIDAPRWVRVEDELPEPNIQCLVRDDDNNCAVGYYRQDAKAWDSPFFGWLERDDEYYEDGDLCRIGKVVAWMPLPEPPKEENK